MKKENQSKHSKGFYLTMWGIILAVALLGIGYATNTFNTNSGTISNTLINDSGIYSQGGDGVYSKSFARTADVVVCRGTSVIDDVIKSFQCDVVCKSTDNDCGDDINTAIGKTTNGRTWYETVLLKGNMTVNKTITSTRMSYTNLIVPYIYVANGFSGAELFNIQTRHHVNIQIGVLEGNKNNVNSANHAFTLQSYVNEVSISGINGGIGYINNFKGRGITTYATSPENYNIYINNIIVNNTDGNSFRFGDQTNNIWLTNSQSINTLGYGITIGRNDNVYIDNVYIYRSNISNLYSAGLVNNLHITNSKFDTSGWGNIDGNALEFVDTAGASTETFIIGNSIVNAKNYGIITTGTDNNLFLTNNYFNNNSWAGAGLGLDIYLVGSNNSVSNNMVSFNMTNIRNIKSESFIQSSSSLINNCDGIYQAGQFTYNSTSNKMMYCNSTNWVNI